MDVSKKAYGRYEKWIQTRVHRADGITALITGGNSGLGYACAQWLLALGARVLLACRSPERGQSAVQRLRAEFPRSEILLLAVDLADLASVDALAEEVAKRVEKIDLLMHFAGVYYPKESQTAQGRPMTVGVNYEGTVRLTEALLPCMDASGRVVFTTSLVDRFGRAKAPRKEGYAAYAQSKLLLSAYAHQKACKRGEKEPAFIAAHPGITATSLLDPAKTTHSPVFSRLGHAFLYVFTHSKEKAALTAVLAALGDCQNGDCIGPRGIFGISGYPHKTSYCRNVKRYARQGLATPPVTPCEKGEQ